MNGKAKGEQAPYYTRSVTKWFKKLKNRLERRRAKIDPECRPGYGRYSGYAD